MCCHNVCPFPVWKTHRRGTDPSGIILWHGFVVASVVVVFVEVGVVLADDLDADFIGDSF